MNQLKLLLIGLTALCGVIGMANGGGKLMICYIGTWAAYRSGDGAFKPEHIDPFLCTHLLYSFFGVNPSSGEIQVLDPWLDLPSGLNNIAKVVALKEKNPDLKIMAVVGGWNEGSVKYSQIAGSPEKRRSFIDSSVKFIKEHGFDGLDLDWEYPGQRGGSPQDKANFVVLLKEMYEALKHLNMIFSIAVGATPEVAKTSYDISNIAKYVDFINLMTYDFHTPDGAVAGANAPLEGSVQVNVKSCVNYWLQQGVAPEKLILGLATYGHTFKLSNPQQAKLGAPAAGPGEMGPYTKQNGFKGYNEICLEKHKWTSSWSNEEKCPYLHNSKYLISYDDVRSIEMKVDFANSLHLGGCMVWSMETDDFRGKCGTKYPLLKAINNKIGKPQDMSVSGNELPPDSISYDETPGTSELSESSKPVDTGDCSKDGSFANKVDCSTYYRCVAGKRYDLNCPTGLHFDVSTDNCNWPELVQC